MNAYCTYSPDLLAKASLKDLECIFTDEKLAKQILGAAKRVAKKRGSGDVQLDSPSKRKKAVSTEPLTPTAIEESLSLPNTVATEDHLMDTVLYSNRAPLVLAFAVMLLKYTMPEQPLSSRLSLAQAVVSMNSRSKAVRLGIEKGNSAVDDGWGAGQPKIRVMGRDVRIMKRWGYDWKEHENQIAVEDSVGKQKSIKSEEPGSTDASNQSSVTIAQGTSDNAPALWGLDLEVLRSSNGSNISCNKGTNNPGLPIYTAQAARSYILKSFASVPSSSKDGETLAKKKSALATKAENENNLGLLLQALDLLYSSWARVLAPEELDRRSWAWYIAVRPEVQDGVAGWGGKGKIKLSDILSLRRKA